MTFNSSGFFIVFEGIDGSGKTNHAKNLVHSLNDLGFKAVYTTEPTEWSSFGKKIRESFTYSERLSAEEEFLLFLEDRKLHIKEEVEPLLQEGRIVVSDRYFYSSVAYQGSRDELDWKHILDENRKHVPDPHLVILLNVSVEEALNRINKEREGGANSFEKKESLLAVFNLFQKLLQLFPETIVSIDSAQPMGTVKQQILNLVLRRLKQGV